MACTNCGNEAAVHNWKCDGKHGGLHPAAIPCCHGLTVNEVRAKESRAKLHEGAHWRDAIRNCSVMDCRLRGLSNREAREVMAGVNQDRKVP